MSGSGKRRLLLVDSDEAAGVVLGAWLRQHGYEVQLEHDGRTALAALSRPGAPWPDLVIADLLGQNLDGLELADALSRDPRRPLVLLWTALEAAADWPAEHLAEIGVAGVLTRPLRFAEVRDRIEQLLGAAPPQSQRRERARARTRTRASSA